MKTFNFCIKYVFKNEGEEGKVSDLLACKDS